MLPAKFTLAKLSRKLRKSRSEHREFCNTVAGGKSRADEQSFRAHPPGVNPTLTNDAKAGKLQPGLEFFEAPKAEKGRDFSSALASGKSHAVRKGRILRDRDQGMASAQLVGNGWLAGLFR